MRLEDYNEFIHKQTQIHAENQQIYKRLIPFIRKSGQCFFCSKPYSDQIDHLNTKHSFEITKYFEAFVKLDRVSENMEYKTESENVEYRTESEKVEYKTKSEIIKYTKPKPKRKLNQHASTLILN